MVSIADYMTGMQPGMALPTTSATGYAPVSFQDVLSNIMAQQPQQVAMPPQPAAIQNGDMSLAGIPNGQVSSKIQQWLGAKQTDSNGQINEILAGRFPQAQPTFNDIGNSAIQTLQSGQYVPAQQEANQRVTGGIDIMSKLANMQELQARSGMYQAMAMNGGGRGEGLAAAMRMMAENNSDPSKKPMTFTDAYMLATAKQGQGVTVAPDGSITTMQGAPQAAEAMSRGREAGTQVAKQQYGPVTAGMEAEQKEVGAARGASQVNLATIQAQMPQINQIVDKLHELGKVSTYTQAGIAYNTARRQIGLPSTNAAQARAEYQSTIDNFLLPSLKATFGARVTNFDIEAAKGMMADPNLSPEEKDAQLRAFIRGKMLAVQSDAQQVQNLGGAPVSQGATVQAPISSGNGGVVNFNDLPP